MKPTDLASRFLHSLHLYDDRHGRGWVLTDDQLHHISSRPFVYNASAGSYLEMLGFQRFWTWLSGLLPMSLSPCLITCTGLAINLLCGIVLILHSPDAQSEAPWWSFVLCAVGLFLYQTLDALDGKQAIRCQNTQIEELYDHSCDSVSTVFVTFTVCAAMNLGSSPPLLFLAFLSSVLAFFSTHWQNHVTHTMVFGKIDVTEGQCMMVLVHLLTGFYGQHIWMTPLFGFEIRFWLAWMSLLAAMVAVGRNVLYVLGMDTPLDAYVKIPRKKNLSIWNPFLSTLVLTLLTWRCYVAGLFALNPAVFFLAFGFAFAKNTTKLVMANAVHGPVELWDSCLLTPACLALNASLPILPSYTALLCAAVVATMDFARYFTYASWDLRDALDAWIFTLKYPTGDSRRRTGNLGFYINGLNNSEILKDKENVLKQITPTLIGHVKK